MSFAILAGFPQAHDDAITLPGSQIRERESSRGFAANVLGRRGEKKMDKKKARTISRIYYVGECKRLKSTSSVLTHEVVLGRQKVRMNSVHGVDTGNGWGKEPRHNGCVLFREADEPQHIGNFPNMHVSSGVTSGL